MQFAGTNWDLPYGKYKADQGYRRHYCPTETSPFFIPVRPLLCDISNTQHENLSGRLDFNLSHKCIFIYSQVGKYDSAFEQPCEPQALPYLEPS